MTEEKERRECSSVSWDTTLPVYFASSEEQYNFSDFSFYGQVGNSQNARPCPFQDLLFIYCEHPVSCPNVAAQVLQGNSSGPCLYSLHTN